MCSTNKPFWFVWLLVLSRVFFFLWISFHLSLVEREKKIWHLTNNFCDPILFVIHIIFFSLADAVSSFHCDAFVCTRSKLMIINNKQYIEVICVYRKNCQFVYPTKPKRGKKIGCRTCSVYIAFGLSHVCFVWVCDITSLVIKRARTCFGR